MNAHTTPRPDPAIEALTETARFFATARAPRHDTGLYALSDTDALYARRLLLQATASMFPGEEGKLLRALDAWLTLGGRQRFYTEADSAALQGIACDLVEAAEAISEEIGALQDRIDGV